MMTKPVGLSRDEIEIFLAQEFPQIFVHGKIWEILDCAPKTATMRMAYHESQLRPGGTISGPAMMTLGDLALYVALLATIGHVPLAVTTSFNVNFLRKPEPRPLIGECRLLKVGLVWRWAKSRCAQKARQNWSPISPGPMRYREPIGERRSSGG